MQMPVAGPLAAQCDCAVLGISIKFSVMKCHLQTGMPDVAVKKQKAGPFGAAALRGRGDRGRKEEGAP